MQKRIKKTFHLIGNVLAGIVCLISLVVGFALLWMNRTWKHLAIDELIYTLSTPKDGTDIAMIKSFFITVILPATIIFILLMVILLYFRKNKRIKHVTAFAALVLPLLFGITVSVYTVSKLDVLAYAKNRKENAEFIDKNYIDPSQVAITFPEKKRNLIYIVSESLETADADIANGGAFSDNYIPELTALAKNNETFSGSDSTTLNGSYILPGGTWTMGGLFSQTAGVPLQISVDQNDMEHQATFFPELTTLGDVLSDAGYHQTFLLGSNATFAGRDKYFTEHGNFELLDYAYAKQNGWIPEDYGVWWGYEDEKLFQFAKEQLAQISSGSEPFNLTLLTADTHFEDGLTCQLCRNEYPDNPYANVYRCSDRQITAFIRWIQTQDFYENTTIVLAGDHCTMDSDFFDNADVSLDNYERKGYLTIINAPISYDKTKARDICAYDLFPTTLAALGADIEGNRLGLGTNLYSDQISLFDKYGLMGMKVGVSGDSPMMKRLSKIVIPPQ